MQAAPYRKLHDDYLALACSLGLTCLLLCAIFYKFASLTELPDVQARMSIEQRADFQVASLLLSVIFILCVFGALGFSFLLILSSSSSPLHSCNFPPAVPGSECDHQQSTPLHVFVVVCW